MLSAFFRPISTFSSQYNWRTNKTKMAPQIGLTCILHDWLSRRIAAAWTIAVLIHIFTYSADTFWVETSKLVALDIFIPILVGSQAKPRGLSFVNKQMMLPAGKIPNSTSP